jgi:CDP-diglyceride synthetase
MHPLLIAQLLALLVVANGTPIMVEKFLGKFLAFPIDGGATFADGKPLFGSSKTLRGLALSILATTAFAPLIGLDWRIGALVAAMAMLGDLFSSFLKRRMGLEPSRQAMGLDQIPESLLPLLACWFFLPLTIVDVVAATVIFFVGELSLSRVLFKLGIRNRPY